MQTLPIHLRVASFYLALTCFPIYRGEYCEPTVCQACSDSIACDFNLEGADYLMS